jgi:hypothetical protein
MRLTNTPEQLFYPAAINDKAHFKVRWAKYKEQWDGMKLIAITGKIEYRLSGNFTTRAGAEGFIKSLHSLTSFTGWYKIIEVK